MTKHYKEDKTLQRCQNITKKTKHYKDDETLQR